jgi:hypothetical protein
MKKTIKKIFIFTLIGLVVLLGTLSLIAEFFEDQIGSRLVKEVNKQLTSELTIQEFDLSIIRAFPNVAANLNGVVLEDSRDGVLLEAEKLSFRFGLLSLLSSNVKFKSLVISNGALNVEIDKQGQANYEIFTESDTESSSSDAAISLNKATLQDVELIYVDEKAEQAMRFILDKANFSGELSSKKFELISDAAFTSDFIEMDGQRFFAGKDLGYKADILVDMEKGFYDFQDVVVQIESNEFNIDGTITSVDVGSEYNLTFNSEDGNLESVIQLLPEEMLAHLGDFRSTGDFLFSGTIEGVSTENQGPRINGELSLDNGKITSPRLENAFKDVSFVAKFTNGKNAHNRSSVFEIQNLKGYFNRELIEFKIKVSDFDNPNIDFLLDGVLPLEPVYGLFNNPKITDGHGEIEIKQLKLNGRYADMTQPSRIYRVETSGDLEFDDAGFTINGERMLLDRGILNINNNLLTVQDVKLEGAGSEIEFNGSANNLIPVMFADSLNSQRAELDFQANLISKNIDMDRLMKLSALYGAEEEVTEEEFDSLAVEQLEKREHITQFLNGSFNAQIEDFNFNKINADDFSGKLTFENNSLLISGRTNAMDGEFDLDGRLFFEARPRLKAKLVCNNINVTEFFAQAENFGQDVLVAKNVKGQLQAQIVINAYWDEFGNYEDEKLHVLAGIGIEDGELVKFKMLEDFSTFVKIKDLRRIRFVNMENYLEIKENRLYIPVMFIQSNALNLTISGSHTLENEINYNLKVNAGQVLANKFRSHDPSLKPKKAKRRGFFNLHYNISGTIDEYEFKSSKKIVRADFESSQRLKNQVRRALMDEFGEISLIDEPKEWEDASGETEEDEFIEWEEEGGK